MEKEQMFQYYCKTFYKGHDSFAVFTTQRTNVDLSLFLLGEIWSSPFFPWWNHSSCLSSPSAPIFFYSWWNPAFLKQRFLGFLISQHPSLWLQGQHIGEVRTRMVRWHLDRWRCSEWSVVDHAKMISKMCFPLHDVFDIFDSRNSIYIYTYVYIYTHICVFCNQSFWYNYMSYSKLTWMWKNIVSRG